MTITDMPIGEASRCANLPIETIRYYERIGLIAPPPRYGKYRIFRPVDVTRLRFIRRARELDFSLEAIRTLLALATVPTDNCAAAQTLGASHLADITAKIADLTVMAQILSDTIAQCNNTGRTADCPLIEALSAQPYSPDSSRRR
ncbi:MAG: helix-turn-helix domain-containing protein [Acidiphilium sp.]|nr:helix-turn-helix domain-containing protein [Acidiphilium sp.]MDD4936150.1 helix-turn-helix domain-containing protein [Acidiphilium sp.]